MQNPYQSPDVETFRGVVNRTLTQRFIRIYLKILAAGLLIVPLYNVCFWCRDFFIHLLLGYNEQMRDWLAVLPSGDVLVGGLFLLVSCYAVIKEFV